MMQYVRELFWLSAMAHDFRLSAPYIHTKSNVLADTLSRGDFASFANHLKDWKSDAHANLRTCDLPSN
jgi:hypothetical protein